MLNNKSDCISQLDSTSSESLHMCTVHATMIVGIFFESTTPQAVRLPYLHTYMDIQLL